VVACLLAMQEVRVRFPPPALEVFVDEVVAEVLDVVVGVVIDNADVVVGVVADGVALAVDGVAYVVDQVQGMVQPSPPPDSAVQPGKLVDPPDKAG
jgi:hypothetical protein